MIVDSGIDCLDPIDPQAGMGIPEVRKNGHRIALKGNVDCAELLTFGTPEETVEATKQTLSEGMPGGGFICSSSNSIHSGVKPETDAVINPDVREIGDIRERLESGNHHYPRRGAHGDGGHLAVADNGHVVRLVGTHLDDEIIRACQNDRFHPGLRRRIPDGVQPYYFSEFGGRQRRRRDRQRRELARCPLDRTGAGAGGVAGRNRAVAVQGGGGGRRRAADPARRARVRAARGLSAARQPWPRSPARAAPTS